MNIPQDDFTQRWLRVEIFGMTTSRRFSKCLGLLLCATVLGCGGSSTSSPGSSGGTCNATATCGGTLDGTWQLGPTCVQGNLAAAITAGMSSVSPLPPACNNIVQSANLTATGTVTYANGMETDNITTTNDVTFLYTPACVSALAGSPVTLNATVCSAMTQEMVDRGYPNATCSSSNGGCACSVSLESTSDPTPLAYTNSGHTINYSDGSDPMDYCVSGTTLTISATMAGMTGVTIVTTAQKN